MSPRRTKEIEIELPFHKMTDRFRYLALRSPFKCFAFSCKNYNFIAKSILLRYPPSTRARKYFILIPCKFI